MSPIALPRGSQRTNLVPLIYGRAPEAVAVLGLVDLASGRVGRGSVVRYVPENKLSCRRATAKNPCVATTGQ